MIFLATVKLKPKQAFWKLSGHSHFCNFCNFFSGLITTTKQQLGVQTKLIIWGKIGWQVKQIKTTTTETCNYICTYYAFLNFLFEYCAQLKHIITYICDRKNVKDEVCIMTPKYLIFVPLD